MPSVFSPKQLTFLIGATTRARVLQFMTNALTCTLRATAGEPDVARVSVRTNSFWWDVRWSLTPPPGGLRRWRLDFAVTLINRVTAGVAVRTGVHVCRGNWSRDEATLLRGGYQPLAPYLQQLQVTQLVLEYATDRAGDILSFPGKELGLGVVNPRADRIETTTEIRRHVEQALKCFAPDRIFLNPDCGFGTFSSRPMNSLDVAMAKVRAIAAAAAELRAAVDV